MISLKLYQLTVLRSETEEKEEEDEITLPSVDNMDLLKSKAHYLTQTEEHTLSLALLYSNKIVIIDKKLKYICYQIMLYY